MKERQKVFKHHFFSELPNFLVTSCGFYPAPNRFQLNLLCFMLFRVCSIVLYIRNNICNQWRKYGQQETAVREEPRGPRDPEIVFLWREFQGLCRFF